MRDSSGSFAAYLRDAMRAIGIDPEHRGSAAELARRADLSQTQISRWLNRNDQPDINSLRKLVPVLRARMIDMLIAADYITPIEAAIDKGGHREVGIPTAEETIQADPRLTEREKRMMLAMLAEARDRYTPGEHAADPDSAAVEGNDGPRESA